MVGGVEGGSRVGMMLEGFDGEGLGACEGMEKVESGVFCLFDLVCALRRTGLLYHEHLFVLVLREEGCCWDLCKIGCRCVYTFRKVVRYN